MASPEFHSGSINGVDICCPTFLSQFLVTEDFDKSCEEHVTCLFEVLDEVHGPDVVSQVDYVMESVINSLSSSLVLDPVQHACAKLVEGIATYGVHRCDEEGEKRDVLQSLCVPLSKCLLENRDGLIYGSALCLEALVGSVNWKFASDEMVNDVCLKVAVALEEKHTQTIAHMCLAMALAKHNSLILEPYARSLIRSALRILNAKIEENESLTKVTVIQLVNVLMKSVDPRSVSSELEIVVNEMDNCCTDRITKCAAFEAMKTAREIIWKNGLERDTNFDRSRRNENARDLRGQSVPPMSPDSQYVYSSFERNSSNRSILSKKQLPNIEYDGNSAYRRHWKEIGSLRKVSHSFMEVDRNSSEINPNYFSDGEVYVNEVDAVVFSGLPRSTPRRRAKTQSESCANDTNFYTPRRVPRKIPKSIRRPLINQLERSLAGEEYGDPNFEIKANNNSGILAHSIGSRSASSTTDKAANKNFNVPHKINSEYNALFEPRRQTLKASTKVGLVLVIGLSIILAVILFPMWTDNQPTINFFPT